MAKSPSARSEISSAGHKLGQIVGDWWELHVLYPVLLDISRRLNLFLDNRCVTRSCRREKIEWPDADGNIVDYDFVLEFDGSDNKRGIPVAFFESFWRRGARHSKDKARDDTNKLLPMRETYPTARFLAIAACGEFTEPARDYVRNRQVDLFFIPKLHIVRAFQENGVAIDYPDNLPEQDKLVAARAVEASLNEKTKSRVAQSLINIAGKAAFHSFETRIQGALTALPQEIRFVQCDETQPARFSSLSEADAFLESPVFGPGEGAYSYRYEVTYSDGFEFSRDVSSIDELRDLQRSLTAFVDHISQVTLG